MNPKEKMLTNKIYTISRFCIATACIILGISEFISPRYVNPTIVSIVGPIIPESFAVIALVELIGGFFYSLNTGLMLRCQYSLEVGYLLLCSLLITYYLF